MMEDAAKKQKKEKGPMTQEDLLKNLKTVVDKREVQSEVAHIRPESSSSNTMHDGNHVVYTSPVAVTEDHPWKHTAKEDEYNRIKISLSSKGYGADDIPKDVLDRDRVEVEKIMSLEIPVGTSATILQCGNGVSALLNTDGWTAVGKSVVSQSQSKKKDFSMVLDLYNELIKVDEKKRHGDKTHPSTSSQRPTKMGSSTTTQIPHPSKSRPMVQGKPIIIVPNAMTSPITLVNASLFFEKSIYMSRDAILKQQSPGTRKPTGLIQVSRKISPRLGGGMVEYEVIDNPAMKLSKNDWDRVVAVIAQGASWQFKGWNMKVTSGSSEVSAVDIFSKCFGFYIGFEGSPIPQEVMGWNVKKGMLSKDKRGMDSVVAASFWNGLDEWMSVHKPEYLPLEEN
jgi:parafibromin